MTNVITSRPRGRAPRQLQSATAQEILEAAILDFDEAGFSGASVGRIAEHAGVSKSLVTYYFPTKASLAAAILDQAYCGGVFMGIQRQVSSPVEAIMQATHHVASSVAHNGLARVALRLRYLPELSHSGPPVQWYGWLTRINDYLDEARRAGLICDEIDVETESRLLVAGVAGLLSLAMQMDVFLFLVDDAITITRHRIDRLVTTPSAETSLLASNSRG